MHQRKGYEQLTVNYSIHLSSNLIPVANYSRASFSVCVCRVIAKGSPRSVYIEAQIATPHAFVGLSACIRDSFLIRPSDSLTTTTSRYVRCPQLDNSIITRNDVIRNPVELPFWEAVCIYPCSAAVPISGRLSERDEPARRNRTCIRQHLGPAQRFVNISLEVILVVTHDQDEYGRERSALEQ